MEFGLEPEAIASEAPVPALANEPVQLISCGRLTPIKSVDQALAALLAVRGKIRPFHFHIVGEGSERPRLERMVVEAGAGDAVTFHGGVTEEQKRALLAASDIFVLSSPREGFSIATLEAMARGCAAVVVNDSAHPNGALDFVRDEQEGLVIAPGAAAMREVLRRLIHEPALRLRLRRAAWETAQEYRIETQARKLAGLYER
jgi:glycosyltransferase involved in cell wall biosynthesis